MATPNANPSASEEIRIGMANACLMMPSDSGKRREEVERLHHLADSEREAVNEAKADSGYAEHKKRLGKVYGIDKTTLSIMKLLDGVKKPGDRAAVLTRVGLLSQDCGYLDKDLVSLAQDAAATAGQRSDDQGSVFDRTGEGQRRGGADAQPKPMEAKPDGAVPHQPTPGIPLAEARAKLEAYLAANPPKPGRKPAERKLLEMQVADAEAVEKQQAAAAEPVPEPVVEPGPDGEGSGEPGPDELPEPQPGEISQSIREGTAEAEAFIAEQSQRAEAKDAASGAAPAGQSSAHDLPPPAPRRGSPLAGAGGQGTYTLN